MSGGFRLGQDDDGEYKYDIGDGLANDRRWKSNGACVICTYRKHLPRYKEEGSWPAECCPRCGWMLTRYNSFYAKNGNKVCRQCFKPRRIVASEWQTRIPAHWLQDAKNPPPIAAKPLPPELVTPEYYIWLRVELIPSPKMDGVYDAAYFKFPDVDKRHTIRFEHMAQTVDGEGRIGILGWKAQELGLIPRIKENECLDTVRSN
jgi:hypothetical protein